MGKNVLPISLNELIILANEAGVIARKYHNLPPFEMGLVIKGDHTPVTFADQQINSLVIERVKSIDPAIDIIGEEESVRTKGPWRVVVDPIDGTMGYVHGAANYTVMIGLMYGHQPVASVIYDPVLNVIYAAKLGESFTENGIQKFVSGRTVGDLPKPSIGFVTWHECGVDMYAVCAYLERAGFIMTPYPSIGYMEALVASGRLDGVIFPQSKAWHDTVQGDLMVREAGGKVTDIFGQPMDYSQPTMRGHIMSNGLVHDVLVEAVAKYGKVSW